MKDRKCDWNPHGMRMNPATITTVVLEYRPPPDPIPLTPEEVERLLRIGEKKEVARKALGIGGNRFIVKFWYLASGMEGHADTWTREVWAESSWEAIEKVVQYEYPEDEFYATLGDHKASARDFLRGCLSVESK